MFSPRATKAELVSQIAKKTDVPKKGVETVLKSLIESIQQALKKDGQIRLDGLGTFRVMERKARTGVNPQTRAKIKIPATKAPAFRAAKALKDVVKGTPKKSGTKK
ncbi:MAG: HU family DNA-binding protein [Desulfomonilaceae bacterium]